MSYTTLNERTPPMHFSNLFLATRPTDDDLQDFSLVLTPAAADRLYTLAAINHHRTDSPFYPRSA
jgi:hypothetical protein